MTVARINFSKLPFLGAYALATDRVIAIADGFARIPEQRVRDALSVGIVRANVMRSPLIGVLAVANSKGAVVPDLPGTDERQLSRDLGVRVTLVPGKHTALGNLILANDHGAVISPDMNGESTEVIGRALSVPVKTGTVAGLKTVGAAGLATNRGVLLHPDARESEVKLIESALKVPADVGTVAGGIKYIGICAVANSNGAIAGAPTTGPELGRIESALGLI